MCCNPCIDKNMGNPDCFYHNSPNIYNFLPRGSLSWLLSLAVGLLEDIGYQLSDAIITYTPGMAASLGLTRYEQKLYPDGARFVDSDVFRPMTPFEERPMTIGYVGRLDAEKRIGLLLEAIDALPPEVDVSIVGDGMDAGAVQKAAAADPRITAHGWVAHDELPE